MKPLLKLNIGSGADYRQGYLNVDINPHSKPPPDRVADIRKLPFPANSFDFVLCHHVLEHIPGPIAPVMEELYRVLTPGGTLEIHVPHFAHHGAHCHPEHVHRFDIHTFTHFTGEVLDNPKAAQWPKPKCRFGMVACEYRYRETDHTNTKLNPFKMLLIRGINWLANNHRDGFDRVFCYWFGGCEEIKVILIKNDCR